MRVLGMMMRSRIAGGPGGVAPFSVWVKLLWYLEPMYWRVPSARIGFGKQNQQGMQTRPSTCIFLVCGVIAAVERTTNFLVYVA